MLLSRVTRAVWNKSPQENFKRLTRTGRKKSIWSGGKHRQWNRLPYYLSLFDRLCREAGHPLSFRGKRLLEIGSGPVLGLAPFALIEGAKAVTLIEPNSVELRANQAFQDEYLYPLWASHSHLVDPDLRQDFTSFLRGIKDIHVLKSDIEAISGEAAQFDVILSKSCLEHIADLGRGLDVCHQISSPGSIHAHYVDFTMHREAHRIGSPFGLTYATSRASNPEYLPNEDGLVNLLRASQVRSLFEERFSETHIFPLLDYRGRLKFEALHPDWAGFDHDDLTIANAVVIAIR